MAKLTATLAATAAATAAAVALPDFYGGKLAGLTVLTKEDELVKVGAINLTTGEYTRDFEVTIALPRQKGCKWQPLVGTEGVGTATFHMNRSYFFLTQQVCGPKDAVNQTALVNTYLPYMQAGSTFYYNHTVLDAGGNVVQEEENKSKNKKLDPAAGNATFYHVFDSDYSHPLQDWNLAWDHVCNLVTIAPKDEAAKGSDDVTGDVTYESWMISEYDAQARQQRALVRQTGDYVKRDGLGAMDTYDMSTGGPYQANCGDNCSVFTLESADASSNATQIIGRNFHTGQPLSNVTNSLNVKTMVAPSWPQWDDYYDFLMVGLGQCCTEDHCDTTSEVCKDSPGALALVGYGGAGPGRAPLTALATIGDKANNETLSAEAIADTLRLGVVVEQSYSDQRFLKAYVYVEGRVEVYNIYGKAVDAEGRLEWTATKNATSPPLSIPAPAAWTIGPMLYE